MFSKHFESRSMASQFARQYLKISLIPLIILLILVVTGAIITQFNLTDLIEHSTYDLNKDAEHSLQKLGEQIIQAKARDVAMQVEIYFRMHPNVDIREMRRDPLFCELSDQKVGKTGYTSIYEAQTTIFRVHPNRKTIDRDMSYLEKELPSWWKIVGATRTGTEASGYYDWLEPDGSIRKKYMTCTPARVRLNGKTMIVAATTYIDEFSIPVIDMKNKAEKVVTTYQDYASRVMIIFGVVAGLVLLLTFYGTYYLGSKTGFHYILPIMQLAASAREFGEGKWNVTADEAALQRKDEIGSLFQAFNRMSQQLKDLFGRLEERVTDLKQAQDALKESEEHYRSLFDGIPIGLYRASPEGTILDANPMLVTMLGYPDRGAFMSRRAEDLYMDPGDRAIWQSRMKENEIIQSYELRMKKFDGAEIWVENHSRAVKDEQGRALYYEGSIKDMTEKKRLEAHLQHAERMEAIGTLAGGIAHDFNNLLMVIQGSISLVLHGIKPSHPLYENFINIEKQVRRGANLTGQLLGYARKGRYEVRPLDLNDIIREGMETFSRTRKDIVIHYELAPDIYPVEADAYQIEQVLMNLYINAFDAMVNGGDLFLKTRNVSSDDIIEEGIYKPQSGNYVMLTVIDSGIGMDKKTMDRIFEPFFTTKDVDKGTGLGLSSVYGIVKGHGGHINVDSEPGLGAKFSIFFPASEKTIVEFPDKPKKALKGKGTILLVDDEELVLDVGAKMLEALGYTVIKTPNSRRAIEIYKEQHAGIDLIVLDMIMPDISGGQAFDLFREIYSDAAVLLSSGYSIDGKATEILNRGCRGFIQKPFSIEELSEKIKKIIKEE